MALEDDMREDQKTVLVVDDEPQVKNLVCEVLSSEGYRVLDAGSPEQALDVSGSYEGNIDLMLTDVIMPNMSGPELAERLVPSRPDMKVIYMSGNTFGKMDHMDMSQVHLLQKPVSIVEITAKVKEVLYSSE